LQEHTTSDGFSNSAAKAGEQTGAELHVIETDPQSDPRWETFVLAHPEASIYHHPAWLRALELEYGQKTLNLACEDSNSDLQAILPLLYTRGLPFNLGGSIGGRRLSSLPRTPLGGPLAKNHEAMVTIVRAAVAWVRQGCGIQLQIKTQGPELEGLVDGLVRTPWRNSYLLELPDDPGQLRFGNNTTRHRIKWAVSKAIKLGLKVRVAESEEELSLWWQLYLDVMRRNAVPARPYRLFQSLWRLLRPKGLMQLLLAERVEAGTRRILAGSIFLMYHGTMSYAFTGCKKEDLGYHPNDLIQWHAIHDACRNGFRQYDFGEVPDEHQQLASFKGKWGAEPTPLYRYYCPEPRTVPSAGILSTGSVQRFRADVWKRLPLGVTALFGDWIYRYL